ncbi:hypothetical protein [Mesorhizobium abyssinicae]|uniref:hypothetical protein n=1 Tax=Mesorhizobium abyssinicae TaxID=1209958 RepID=UPI003397DA1A
MAADGLAIRPGPLETAEDRVGFLFVNLDEALNGLSRHSAAIKSCWPSWYFAPPRLSVVIDVNKTPRIRTFQNLRGQAGRAELEAWAFIFGLLMVLDTHDDAAVPREAAKSAPHAYPPEHGRTLSGSGSWANSPAASPHFSDG